MIIRRIEVKNFRSLKDISIECDELVAILGRNGCGKSTILKALDVFYNVGYQAIEYDYFEKETKESISIQVTYGELRDEELREFSSYLSGEELSVTKIINAGGAKYFGVSPQLPEFYDCRKFAASQKRKALTDLIATGKYTDLVGPVPRSEAEVDQMMITFEDNHHNILQPFQREQQFFGPRNVGGGKLDKFTKFVLIPAVRDATSETDKKGIILQLIDVLVARSVNARPDVQKLNKEFEARVKDVYCKENLTELNELATLITSLLSQYAPGALLDLEFGDVVPPKITLPTALASLVEDNFKSPIGYTGHGLQRALILALLQQLSLTDLSPAKPETDEQKTEENKENKASVVPGLILAIEEPELYLHPSRSRFLASVLDRLTKKPADSTEPRTQVMYGTHSPYFIDISRFDRVRLARKIPTEGSPVLQCKLTSFSRANASAALAKISGKPTDTFTAESFVAHAVPVMTAIVNEGFFGDVVVVVEGLTEVGVLWAIQSLLKKNWDAIGIVVVPADGKSKIDRPVVVFRGLGIPSYFLFDADVKHKGGHSEKSTIELNARYLRLAGVEVSDFPLTCAGLDWAVFRDDIEDEIQVAIGQEYFLKVRETVAAEFGYAKPSDALKNPEVAAALIRSIYAANKTIPLLEDIVEKITALKLG